jgi:drug/metabolite transporter (DMT)-like permease
MTTGSSTGWPRALLALFLTILFWATAPLILKYFTGVMDVWTVNGMRYLFTALFWLPVVVRRYREVPAGRAIWRDAWVPALCHMLGQAGWGLAPYYNDASVMNFVSRIAFLLTVVVGFWLLKEERQLARRPLFWVGLSATVAGLVLMFAGGRGSGSSSSTGMAILVWTSVCWSFYSVQVRKRMAGYPPMLGYGVVSLLVAPGLTVAMFAWGDWRALGTLTLGQWSLLAISAWLAIALGHVLYYHAVHAIGPIISEGSMALLPFLTALLAHSLLGERMQTTQWIGGTLLVGATLLLLIVRYRFRVTPQPEEHTGG